MKSQQTARTRTNGSILLRGWPGILQYRAGAGPTHADDILDRLNGTWHERALQVFMVIVLAHWAEHLLQAFQIYALGWPVPEARGALGYFFPYLVTSEMLHYGYALVMLAGLWMLRPGFTGIEDRRWWTIALAIQFFHHIEHFLLQGQYLLGPEPVRPARADQHRPALGAARRAAPLLQHHRVHPDGGRDVLPHVPAAVEGRPMCTCAWHRGLSAAPSDAVALAVAALLAGAVAAVREPAPTTSTASWMLEPAPPVVGARHGRAHHAARRRTAAAVAAPTLRLEGAHVPSRHGAGR